MSKFILTCIIIICLSPSMGYSQELPQKGVHIDNDTHSNEHDINNQLKEYKTVSKWILDNQASFQKVLQETAKKSTTKWLIEHRPENSSKTTVINVNNPPITNEDANITGAKPNLYHSVKAKETLYSIAKQYHTTPEAIKKTNNLKDERYLVIGQKLLIPSMETKEASISPFDSNMEESTFEGGAFVYPKFKYYQVAKGDTIYSISKEVNMLPEELVKSNNLENTNIYPGMILKVNTNYTQMINTKAANKFEWPLVGRLLIGFGPQKSGMVSEGINILAKKGAAVKSVEDGVVIYVGDGVKALGNIVLIQHQSGWVSVYGYLDNIVVKKGEEVRKSQVIGNVGKPTHIKTPQLHFELREHVVPKDPLEYLNSYT